MLRVLRTSSAYLRGFLLTAHGQSATPLWEMALLIIPLLCGVRVFAQRGQRNQFHAIPPKSGKEEKEPDTWKLTLAAPADSPKRVMLSGSPPNERMFLCTQAMAACWSQSPKFPEKADVSFNPKKSQ